ncbi:DNA repair protein endonuclease SAE2/CtIP C-terminus-domain-containing protein [Fimicolochytrium jonesii]|uniref:DNA repair protein endonuclease SAE2/CtIP C-terminus-domain-containing protein n=1 Tax=Fimicolochytrium jonesii TaxID=1396493 RepID=UPI0022FE0700|nr:DNA repair protein endonuclease SAE2/CtIP C-terminus-domain-containing protein [Fimicolochytrium jonesii]KAI8826632.1 DNA repair protein endonuclease SAE2/CtIP C-terminus-domain-containing protein [Fimicolochytrium jonesii]
MAKISMESEVLSLRSELASCKVERDSQASRAVDHIEELVLLYQERVDVQREHSAAAEGKCLKYKTKWRDLQVEVEILRKRLVELGDVTKLFPTDSSAGNVLNELKNENIKLTRENTHLKGKYDRLKTERDKARADAEAMSKKSEKKGQDWLEKKRRANEIVHQHAIQKLKENRGSAAGAAGPSLAAQELPRAAPAATPEHNGNKPENLDTSTPRAKRRRSDKYVSDSEMSTMVCKNNGSPMVKENLKFRRIPLLPHQANIPAADAVPEQVVAAVVATHVDETLFVPADLENITPSLGAAAAVDQLSGTPDQHVDPTPPYDFERGLGFKDPGDVGPSVFMNIDFGNLMDDDWGDMDTGPGVHHPAINASSAMEVGEEADAVSMDEPSEGDDEGKLQRNGRTTSSEILLNKPSSDVEAASSPVPATRPKPRGADLLGCSSPSSSQISMSDAVRAADELQLNVPPPSRNLETARLLDDQNTSNKEAAITASEEGRPSSTMPTSSRPTALPTSIPVSTLKRPRETVPDAVDILIAETPISTRVSHRITPASHTTRHASPPIRGPLPATPSSMQSDTDKRARKKATKNALSRSKEAARSSSAHEPPKPPVIEVLSTSGDEHDQGDREITDDETRKLPRSMGVGAMTTTSTMTTTVVARPPRTSGTAPVQYKYQEVVRNKEQRKKMQAQDNWCCAKFYEAAGPIAPLPELGAPTAHSAGCAHDQKSNAHATHLQAVSRHRHVHKPPNTPPGYWDVDFPTTQEVAVNNKEAANNKAAKQNREKETGGGGTWRR